MPHLSAEAKHHILLEYAPHCSDRSFAALAQRHAIRGGKQTVQQWHSRWDGTAHSLERREGSGRQRSLSSRQVQQYVRAPILRANRAHRAVHYTELVDSVREKTGTDVSVRTLRRYGKEELGAHGTR
jgi:transposase